VERSMRTNQIEQELNGASRSTHHEEGGELHMRRRLRNRRGQSILEYLLIATIIVGAIMLVKGPLTRNMGNLYNGAGNKTNAAASAINTLNFANLGD